MAKHVLLTFFLACGTILGKAQDIVDIGPADAGPVDYLTPGTHEFWIGGRCIDAMTTTGLSSLNDLEVGWSFNGEPWQTYQGKIKSFVPKGKRFSVNIPVTPGFTVATPGQYTLKFFVRSTTIIDPDYSNDTMTKIVHVHNSLPPKNVLFEAMKFQACYPCYAGDTAVNGQISPKPYVNTVRLYMAKGEQLYNATADSIDRAFNKQGHPAYMYDRFRWPYATETHVGVYNPKPDTRSIEDSGHRVRFLEPLSVSFDYLGYDTINRKLVATLKTTVFDTLTGDFRFNLYLTEDSLQYSQSGAPLGKPYRHHRVLREALGYAWGTQNSLPPQLLPGQSYTYTYEYTIPGEYTNRQIRLVGFVQQYHNDTFSRRVLNSVGGPLMDIAQMTAGIKSVKETGLLNLYPNPSKDELRFTWPHPASLRLHLLDASGRLLREWYDKGSTIQVPLNDVPGGNYMLEVTDGNSRYIGRFQKKE